MVFLFFIFITNVIEYRNDLFFYGVYDVYLLAVISEGMFTAFFAICAAVVPCLIQEKRDLSTYKTAESLIKTQMKEALKVGIVFFITNTLLFFICFVCSSKTQPYTGLWHGNFGNFGEIRMKNPILYSIIYIVYVSIVGFTINFCASGLYALLQNKSPIIVAVLGWYYLPIFLPVNIDALAARNAFLYFVPYYLFTFAEQYVPFMARISSILLMLLVAIFMHFYAWEKQKKELPKGGKMPRLFKHTIALLLSICVLCVSAGCQATPEQGAIQQKNGNDLNSASVPTDIALQGNSFSYEKTYNNGLVLKVACNVKPYPQSADVVLIEDKDFDATMAKRITEILAPNKKIYEYQDALTKEQLEAEILYCNEQIYRIEAGLPLVDGDDSTIVPENRRAAEIVNCNKTIEYYEGLYATAPNHEYINATYELKKIEEDQSYQANLYYEEDGGTVDVNYVNWGESTKGSLFLYDARSRVNFPNEKLTWSAPDDFVHDEKYQAAKTEIEQLMKNMGADYLTLDRVSSEKDGYYSFVFTRNYEGLQEHYVTFHTGVSSFADGTEMIALWEAEYFSVDYGADNRIWKMDWHNPSVITGIAEENAILLPWVQIEDIFKKQMDYLLSASDKTEIFAMEKEIVIDRAELGYVKILEKNTKDQYKLVPAWNFWGNNGTCYLTLNAVDGTVIDRGMMY